MINLLPADYKRQLKQEENFRLLLVMEIFILISFVVFSLVLFSIKFYFLGKIQAIQVLVDLERERFETSKIQELKAKITLTNQNLAKLTSFYRQQIKTVEVLEKISETLPPEMYLTSFSWQKDMLLVSLSGFSPNRETLFKFKENLEKEFSQVYFPPSNWVKPTDIEFSASFKIKSK